MAARKLQQEVDKCFKKVSEGVAEFESIYEKIEQSTNAAQKEKLEDNLKREIKKLQRLRDQIKTWAASNDIKNKGPLLDNRKLIETQMERFKAVEKAMKTKAYSKEGLSAATKQDPKERAKIDACDFLGSMVDELERQIETLEAEGEAIQATMRKGKNYSSKADRMAEIERITERHKWHQGKLELIKRSLENGGVETEQVNDLEEGIRYYVSDGMNEDFMEDDELYDELNLQEEEDNYGMNIENDRVSSQDTQSIQEEAVESDYRTAGKSKTSSEQNMAAARRLSTQTRSPLPTMATLHQPMSNVTNNLNSHMKPATLPIRAPGETLKYASAAAAAASSDKMIAPLPPPPDTLPTSSTGLNNSSQASHVVRAPSVTASSQNPLPQSTTTSYSSTTKSNLTASNPNSSGSSSAQVKSPSSSPSSLTQSSSANSHQPNLNRAESTNGVVSRGSTVEPPIASESIKISTVPQTKSAQNSEKAVCPEEVDDSIFHLPSGLQDLLHSFEATQKRAINAKSPSSQKMINASFNSCPDIIDSMSPQKLKPRNPIRTPSYYPQSIDPVFEDPRLYTRIDPDTLFYVFYYKQETYQQFLAAKALKDQSWRFHKQYQTWFQRHEEPKTITEEYEQGTYRFFDYESTWMNRRKADFKFAYKFLEDDV
ncbi:CCR4-NOT transcription complex subunit 3 [Golovinomyces cichoracearum]|uniref:General negative regulator of transcription subunit n=1 Tax=Golovinomyces cichoracearum TaxID=62708 RepID=A0A420IN87_9PEZI|nr:CCR4-NOT transcription complex subunit 3 [Golovinomyces cichoracearum]